MKKGWFKKALLYLGLISDAATVLADTAKDVAPLAGANAKQQADIEKAARAAKAAQGIGKAADRAAKKLP